MAGWGGGGEQKTVLPYKSQSRKRNIKSLPKHLPSNHATKARAQRNGSLLLIWGLHVNEVGN